jgi:hypothetical protein
MAWQAVEAEIAREMREYSNTENLEELLYQAWLYSMSVQRERHRDLYGTWRLDPDWKERKRTRDAKCNAKRAVVREERIRADVRICTGCGSEFRRTKFNPNQKRCSAECRKLERRTITAIPSRPCDACGRQFQPAASALLKQRCCSRKCRRSLSVEQRRKATP